MSKFTKYVVLGVTLIIPVFIYVFLELFGSNQFTVPSYYQEEIPDKYSECSGVRAPYGVSFSGDSLIDYHSRGKIILVNPVVDECFDCPPNLNEIKRVLNKHNDIKVVSFYETVYTSITDDLGLPKGWDLVGLSQVDLIELMRCKLLLDMPQTTTLEELSKINRLVLIDPQGKIRGYYEKEDREEIDRLIVELSILKQEFDYYE